MLQVFEFGEAPKYARHDHRRNPKHRLWSFKYQTRELKTRRINGSQFRLSEEFAQHTYFVLKRLRHDPFFFFLLFELKALSYETFDFDFVMNVSPLKRVFLFLSFFVTESYRRFTSFLLSSILQKELVTRIQSSIKFRKFFINVR